MGVTRSLECQNIGISEFYKLMYSCKTGITKFCNPESNFEEKTGSVTIVLMLKRVERWNGRFNTLNGPNGPP